jgi:hypothetical protein
MCRQKYMWKFQDISFTSARHWNAGLAAQNVFFTGHVHQSNKAIFIGCNLKFSAIVAESQIICNNCRRCPVTIALTRRTGTRAISSLLHAGVAIKFDPSHVKPVHRFIVSLL